MQSVVHQVFRDAEPAQLGGDKPAPATTLEATRGAGGGKGTVGTVTVTVRTGVETVVEGGTTGVVTDATGAVTAPTVLTAAAAG